jgi:hypothetical protein
LKVIDEEFEEVFHNLELIEGKKYTEEEQDNIKNSHLVKYYITPYLEKLNKKRVIPESEKTREFYAKILERIKAFNVVHPSQTQIGSYTPGTKTVLPKLKNFKLYDVDPTDIYAKTGRGHRVMKKFKDVDNKIISI